MNIIRARGKNPGHLFNQVFYFILLRVKRALSSAKLFSQHEPAMTQAVVGMEFLLAPVEHLKSL